MAHWSDCALHNAPAMEPGPCDCGNDAPEGPEPDGIIYRKDLGDFLRTLPDPKALPPMTDLSEERLEKPLEGACSPQKRLIGLRITKGVTTRFSVYQFFIVPEGEK